MTRRGTRDDQLAIGMVGDGHVLDVIVVATMHPGAVERGRADCPQHACWWEGWDWLISRQCMYVCTLDLHIMVPKNNVRPSNNTRMPFFVELRKRLASRSWSELRPIIYVASKPPPPFLLLLLPPTMTWWESDDHLYVYVYMYVQCYLLIGLQYSDFALLHTNYSLLLFLQHHQQQQQQLKGMMMMTSKKKIWRHAILMWSWMTQYFHFLVLDEASACYSPYV